MYFGELKHIAAGEREPYRPKYDYAGVDLGVLPVPNEWFIPAGLAEDMKILEEYAGWKLAKIKAGVTLFGSKYTCPVYVIVDHHDRIRQYSAIPDLKISFPIKERFDKIKRQIRRLPQPDRAKQAPAAK